MKGRAFVAAIMAGAVGLAACGSGPGRRAAPSAAAPSPAAPSPAAPAAGPAPSATGGPGLTTPEVTVPAGLTADPGLPSQLPPGPLAEDQVKSLMQYFEDGVNQAYGAGDPDGLYRYLAGAMLTGNRATVNFLNNQHRRNVLRVSVNAVSISSNSANRVVFDMSGELTANYFVDTQSNRILQNGLPGPSQIDFLCFVDYNPAAHTWYWTGEQSQAANAGVPGQQ